MLKLYFHPFSTYARRARMALLEKQIAYEPITLDMAKREHRQPAYLALNPYGRVPTLVEDDFVLYESTAILTYLEQTHPAHPLMPLDARGRAHVEMHMKLCDLQLARPTGQIIFPKRFLPKERWNLDVIATAKKEIESHLAILESQLAGKSYLVGENFTLADLCYVPFIEFLGLMEITAPPGVAAWAARLQARESAQQTKPSM